MAERDLNSGANARLAVIGCGHVGAVTAACLASLGHLVVGIDRDREVVECLRQALPRILEPGLGDLIRAQIDAGRLRFEVSEGERAKTFDAAFICIDTPEGAHDAVGRIEAVLRQVASPLLVLKSTLPVGTGKRLAERLKGQGIEVVANPEFLRQGSAVEDFLRPARVVIGSESDDAREKVTALFGGLQAPIVLTDLTTAEMIKHTSNVALAMRVSFANEIAQICAAAGIDVDSVLLGAGLDPRIGSQFLEPGIGFGGSCLPKDLRTTIAAAATLGLQTPLLKAVAQVNDAQPGWFVDLVTAELGGRCEGKVIAAFGATFKGNTEDLRHSPALNVIALLESQGATVRVYDPSISAGERPGVAGQLMPTPSAALEGADALVVLSNWPELAALDYAALGVLMKQRVVIDGRNLLDAGQLEEAGFRYAGVGRQTRATRVAANGAPAAR